MQLEIFNILNKKIKSIVKNIEDEKILEDEFWTGLSLLCSEICNYFKNTHFSYKYYKMLARLFHFLKVLKKNNNYYSSAINESLKIITSAILNPRNDYPIWFLATILQNILLLISFENLQSDFFLLFANDRSSARQKALLNVVSKNTNVSKVQQYIAMNYTDEELTILFGNAFLKEQNENASRIFLNKFNYYTGNIVSFFCDAIDVNNYNLIHNVWIDFSKKWHTLSFLYPRKYSHISVDDYSLRDTIEDGDIVTIKLYSIDHLKFRRDGKKKSVELILELNEPCTTHFQESADLFSNFRIITFKISQELENFRNFIAINFTSKQITNPWNYDTDVNLQDGISDNNDDVIIDTTYDSDNSNEEEFAIIHTPYNLNCTEVSIQETQLNDSFDQESDFSNSQNFPSTSALLKTPKIRSSCVSIPETVKSHVSNFSVKKSTSLKNILEGNLSKLSSPSVLKSLSYTNINSLSQNKQIGNDNLRIKKQSKKNTITQSSSIEKNENLENVTQIRKEKTEKEATQKWRKDSKSKISNVSVEIPEKNIAKTSSSYALYEYPQIDIENKIPRKRGPYKKRKSKKNLSDKNSNDDEFSCKNFEGKKNSDKNLENSKSKESRKAKKNNNEVRTRTRVVKKPKYYDSEAENTDKKRRTKSRNCLTDTEIPVKRIKMLLPLRRPSESISLSQKSINMENNEEINIPSPLETVINLPLEEQTNIIHASKLDAFDLLKLNLPQKQNAIPEKINFFSSSSESTPQKTSNTTLRQEKSVLRENEEKINTELVKTTRNIIEKEINENLEVNINAINESMNNLLEPQINVEEDQNETYTIDNYIEDEIETDLHSINNALRFATRNRVKLVERVISALQDLTAKYKN